MTRPRRLPRGKLPASGPAKEYAMSTHTTAIGGSADQVDSEPRAVPPAIAVAEGHSDPVFFVEPPETEADDDLVVEEVRIEDLLIDGICGVY